MKANFFLLMFLFIFSSEAFPQDKLDPYKRAKTLIGYGNYTGAMELLRPYMAPSEYGDLALFAQYHFGFAAFQNKQMELALSTIKPLTENKTWDKQDDARYLLGLIYFNQSKNAEALQIISLIKDAEIFGIAENASLNYLRNTSVSFLIANLSKFEKNKGYLTALKEQLEKQSILSTEEKAVVQRLRSTEDNPTVGINPNKNLQSLDIAVVLPFSYSGETDVKLLSQGNFVLELFQGIRFALDELQQSGQKINVKTFDTQRNPSKLNQILNDPFLTTADVIIGPVYPEETEIVSQFSQKMNIPFINPLSNIDDKIQKIDHAYLFRPSVASLTKGLMAYIKTNVPGKRLAIGYSSNSRDEMLANKISEEIGASDYKMPVKTLVTPKNINQFFDGLNLHQRAQAKTDAVIILTDDPNIAQTTFGYMESKNIKIPVIVMDSWLYFNFASYEMLENQNFVFLGNNSIDFSNANLEIFRTGFNEEYGKFPSLNMHLGYELTYWISETISPAQGFDFRKNLDKNGFNQGKITYGFDFRDANNNRYVPVLRLYNGKLEVN